MKIIKYLVLLLVLGVCLSFGSEKASAGPEVWTFTCDPWSAFVGGVINVLGSPFMQLKTYCWYEAQYAGGTIVSGEDWYNINVPMPFYKKHGIAQSVESYEYDAERE